MSPFFSIIIPVYNVEKYLKECIESILSQDFNDYEIILVDDGSTDSSGNICDYYSTMNHQVTVIHKENGGQSSARNVGMSVSNGRYIVFIDSDDLLLENVLCQVHKLLSTNDAYDIIQIGSYIFEDGKQKKKFYFGPIDHGFLDGKEYLKYCLHSSFCSTVWAYVYAASFLKENELGFLENVFHEDEDFTISALLKAKSIYVLEIGFYAYRIRPGSTMTSKNQDKNAKDMLVVANCLLEKIDKISDKELKRLLLDRIVTFYISAFMMGKYYKSEFSDKVNLPFMKKNAYSWKNKIKVAILSINKTVFYYIEYIIIHIRGISL